MLAIYDMDATGYHKILEFKFICRNNRSYHSWMYVITMIDIITDHYHVYQFPPLQHQLVFRSPKFAIISLPRCGCISLYSQSDRHLTSVTQRKERSSMMVHYNHTESTFSDQLPTFYWPFGYNSLILRQNIQSNPS